MMFLYQLCAAVGGTVLVVQTLLTLLGWHTEHDLSGDLSGGFAHDTLGPAPGGDHSLGDDSDAHGSTWLFGVITIRTVVAALTFFGLVGLAASSSDVAPLPTLTVALGAGVAAMFSVHWLLQQLYKLRSDGTVRIAWAVGKTGTVYVRIPGKQQGSGKVLLNLQDRTVELDAVTAADELPTGTPVVVRQVIGAEVVTVERVASLDEVRNG